MNSSGFDAPKSRSPLKAKPLRNPGQSLDEEIDRLTGDQMGNLLTALACVQIVLAAQRAGWTR